MSSGSGELRELLRFDVYGMELGVLRDGSRWRAYRLGEGKRRELHDLVIPEDLPESELERFLADICHEMATEARAAVRRLAPSAALTPG